MAFWSRLFKDSAPRNPACPVRDVHARAKPSSMYTKPRLFQPYTHAHTSRPLPTGRRGSPLPPMVRCVRLFRIFHPLPTPRRPRRSSSGPSFSFLANISPESISDSRHNDPAFSPLSRIPGKLEGLIMMVRYYGRKKTRLVYSFHTYFEITRIEFISFYKFPYIIVMIIMTCQ